MKRKLSLFFAVLIPFSFTFCITKKGLKSTFPQEIVSTTFEKWSGGRMESGSGATIIIVLKKPLRKDVYIKRVFFQDQETEIVQETETILRANFHSNALYRQHTSSNAASKNFNLKDNEAVIEYQKHNKTYFYKRSNIKEIPMIMYE